MFYKDFKGNKISTLGFGVMRMPTDLENPKIFDRKAGQAIIDRAMELAGGNLSRAAQMLGCTRFTLKRRLGAEDVQE